MLILQAREELRLTLKKTIEKRDQLLFSENDYDFEKAQKLTDIIADLKGKLDENGMEILKAYGLDFYKSVIKENNANRVC